MKFSTLTLARLSRSPRWYAALAILVGAIAITALLLVSPLSSSLSIAAEAGNSSPTAAPSEDEVKAGKYYSEKSYSQAADLWSKVLNEEKPRKQTDRWRELTYRVNDARLRAIGKNVSANQQTQQQQAISALILLTTGVQSVEDEPPSVAPASTVTVKPGSAPAPMSRGRRPVPPRPIPLPTPVGSNMDVWAALANESLGDYYMQSVYSYGYMNGQAYNHFFTARAWWAEQELGEEARVAWLRLYFKPLRTKRDDFQIRGIQWETPSAETAVRLATEKFDFKTNQSPEDVAAAHYTYVVSLMRSNANTPALRKRLLESLEPALALGKKSGWNDDLLIAIAQYYQNAGELYEYGPGQYTTRPDFVTALKYYQRLVSEFSASDSQFYEQAKEAIKEISNPRINLSIGSAFKPGSLIQYSFYTRNVTKLDFKMFKLDYVAAAADNAENKMSRDPSNKKEYRPPGIGAEVRAWSHEVKPLTKHSPTSETLTSDPLPAGAYWLEARADGATDGTIVFVSNTSVSVVQGNEKLVAYVSDATTGLPKANSAVTMHSLYSVQNYMGNWDYENPRAKTTTGTTNKDGLVELTYPKFNPSKESLQNMLVVAVADEEPSVATVGGYYNNRAYLDAKAYIYTDSPAYKPGDTVKFRVIYREHDGTTYKTTPNKAMKVVVRNPQGEKVLEKSYDLNEFGSLTDSFALPKETPLGAYMVNLEAQKDRNGNTFNQSSELFRIEEFKLPEFRVEVKVPEKDGRPVIFRPGDRIRAEVKVTYYSGGVVANGDIEYDISQNYYYGDNPWPEPYPWFYRDIQSSNPWMRYYRDYNNHGQNIIKRGNVKTDDKGVAYIEYDTPASINGAMEYSFAIRATDASRRMVTGSGSLKVSSSPFFIHIKPNSQIYEPGATATVEGKAVDANGKPVEMKGTLTLERKRFVRKVAKDKAGTILRTVFNGYETKQIETRDISTDKEGSFKVTLPVAEEGYYTVSVVSPAFDKKASATGDEQLTERAKGEATFFAANKATRSLGYTIGNLQIIPDKVTYRVGETARLIVMAPRSGGAAVLSVHGTDLLSYQLVRMDGMAKLVEVPVTEAHQPNAMLSAFAIRDGRMDYAQEEIVVPPSEHFLNFALTPEKTELRPGDKSAWTVRVTDRDGKPVQAEVSLGVVDAAIYYIQQDLAGDIRQHFYGEKRSFYTRSVSSLQNRGIVMIEKPAKEEDVTIMELGDNEQAKGGSWEPEGKNIGHDYRANRGSTAMGGMSANKNEAVLFDGAPISPTTPAPMASAAPAAEGMAQDAAAPGSGAHMRTAMPKKPSTMNKAKQRDKDSKSDSEDGAEPLPDQPLTVRSDFRVSAFWDASVKTDADGKARMEVSYPESLTEWKAVARGVTKESQFGFGDSVVRTAQPLMVRLQTPRFVVEGDKFTITSVINNETDKPVTVKTKIDAKNLESIKAAPGTLTVQPRVQGRIEAEFEAKLPGGTAEITASGTSPEGSDGMRLPLPIVEHGIEKFIARSFVLSVGGDGLPATAQAEFALNVPEKRNPGTTKLDFILTPSLASTCLDALPYLADYPYGCVEQTMSRFLPACVAAKTLKDLNLEPEFVAGRLFGGMEAGSAKALKMKKGDLSRLNEMTAKGLARLADFQHGDGGWGWWKDDTTNDYMTAYVVQGMALAKRAGVEVPEGMISRGAEYLKNRLVQYKNDPDNAAWLLYAISLGSSTWEPKCERAAKLAYENRQDLSAYTRSLLALALWEKRPPAGGLYNNWAKILIENLENGVQEVKAESELIGKAGSATMPVTCFWGEAGMNYRWRDGSIEATSMALRAMLAIDPQNKRVDQAARWLINNRRGAQWKNTKDTAITILSMLDYIRATKEGETEINVEVLVNGEVAETVKIGKAESLGTLPINIPESKLKTGDNKVTVKVTGKGRLYASAYLKYFTKEEPITAAGNEVYVKREYFRETSVPKLIQGITTKQVELKDGDKVVSGDKIIVKLTLEAKNDYEYLVFEDKKPAGFEAVQVKSGEPAYARQDTGDGKFQGPSTWIYQELRDQHVAFFITALPNGKHQITYELRAETPGVFHGLPTMGHAMYVPEIRCNSDEFRVTVQDKPEAKP